MKFKAAILERINQPLIVDDIEIDSPLEPGQVIVQIKASGICGAQIGEITGAKGLDKFLPHLLGHEGGGVVVETGPGVRHIKRGDHVALHWRKGVGIDAGFPKYKWGNKTVGGGQVTTFAEYAIISENRLTPIAKDVPFEIAALMGCGVTTGLGLINNEAQLKIGQSICVIGCGGVGLNVIQGAALVGAGKIHGIDIYEIKRFKALDIGATDAFPSALIGKLPKNYDVVVDCTGIPEMIDKGYSLVAPDGKLILVGQPRYNQSLTINNMRQHYCGKTIIDSQGGLTNPTIDIPRYIKLYQQDKLKLDGLITHKFQLKDINQAIDKMRSGETGRVILEM
jgi:S-(hydroxymethyl)glutathione dehydrogenase/alcohol dehydrogenase